MTDSDRYYLDCQRGIASWRAEQDIERYVAHLVVEGRAALDDLRAARRGVRTAHDAYLAARMAYLHAVHAAMHAAVDDH